MRIDSLLNPLPDDSQTSNHSLGKLKYVVCSARFWAQPWLIAINVHKASTQDSISTESAPVPSGVGTASIGVTNADSENTEATGTLKEAVDLFDQYQDLVALAKEGDGTTSIRRAWPLPFTIERKDAADPDSQGYQDARFVFAYLDLAKAVQGEDASFEKLTSDYIKAYLERQLRLGKGTANITTPSGDKTFRIKRWSREAYLDHRIKQGCSPQEIVAELKGVSGYTTTNMVCYEYGVYNDWTRKLTGFAAGPSGLERMCDETGVAQLDVEKHLRKDWEEWIFWARDGDGTWTRWLIRRLA
jgi:hypothetical protein